MTLKQIGVNLEQLGTMLQNKIRRNFAAIFGHLTPHAYAGNDTVL